MRVARADGDGVPVIGIGSDHGFDRLGWEVISELARRAARQPWLASVPVILARNRRLGAPLLEQLEGRRRAIIVDALATGAPSRTVVRRCVDRRLRSAVEVSSHGFGLAQTLLLGQALGALPEELVILGLEIPPAQDAAPTAAEVCTLADAVIAELRSEATPRPGPLNN